MILLHSDDFGLRQSADNLILESIKKGSISSVSVLIDTASRESLDQLRDLQKAGKVQIFLHLNVRGDSLPWFVTRLFLGLISPQDLRQEIIRQIDSIKSKDVKIDGLDSEQHTHALSPIAEIVSELTKEYHIPHVRSYGDIKTFTFEAKLKYGFLRLIARLSSLRFHGKFGLPVSWARASNQNRKMIIMSWEGRRLDVSNSEFRIHNSKLTLVTHPYMGFDTNTSYEKLL